MEADHKERADKRAFARENGFQNGKSDEAAIGEDGGKHADLALGGILIKGGCKGGKQRHQGMDEKADQCKKQTRFQRFDTELLADEGTYDHHRLAQFDDQRGQAL